MKYLEQVIKESLRLYPSVPYIGRETVEDLKFSKLFPTFHSHKSEGGSLFQNRICFITEDGGIIPKGTQVYIIMAALHKNPKIWKNPEEFNPENYSPENIAKKHPYAATPFSAGPRNCIGKLYLSNSRKKFCYNSK